MTARDELAELKSRAEKFIAANARMIELGGGIGLLYVEAPDLHRDWEAWADASDVDHADTVLAIIEAAQPRTITTAEELNALPAGSVILDPAGLSLHKNEFTGWCASNGAKNIAADMLRHEALPATVIYEPEPQP